jgi:hypothetical protein
MNLPAWRVVLDSLLSKRYHPRRFRSQFPCIRFSLKIAGMATKLQIPKNQIPNFGRIRDIGVETLDRICTALEAMEPPPMSAAQLSDEILSVVSGREQPTADTSALVGQLLAWSQVARNRSLSVKQVMDAISASVENLSTWTASDKRVWQDIQPSLQRLCETKAVRMVSKIMDLSYDYANLFEGSRIVTDIRPVFNDADDDEMGIDGAVVSYTLRLNYDNRSGRQSLSITMDEFDIHSLLSQCERALQKGHVAQESFSKVAPSVRAGEDLNG